MLKVSYPFRLCLIHWCVLGQWFSTMAHWCAVNGLHVCRGSLGKDNLLVQPLEDVSPTPPPSNMEGLVCLHKFCTLSVCNEMKKGWTLLLGMGPTSSEPYCPTWEFYCPINSNQICYVWVEEKQKCTNKTAPPFPPPVASTNAFRAMSLVSPVWNQDGENILNPTLPYSSRCWRELGENRRLRSGTCWCQEYG